MASRSPEKLTTPLLIWVDENISNNANEIQEATKRKILVKTLKSSDDAINFVNNHMSKWKSDN
jgi:hypothetical protein